MTGTLLSLLGSTFGGGGGFTVIQTFTATSTWTCPAGVTEVEYLVVAGGGGGGRYIGGGGGAGGFDKKVEPLVAELLPYFWLFLF